jgi:phthiodiolone/phenolphthiodiolone dimycocerosates ketoreductase
MATPPLLFGEPGINFPPRELMEQHVREAEQIGATDYFFLSDQLNLTYPRSLWTPDLVPGADQWDCDTWMDPFIAMAIEGSVTPRIKMGLTSVDCSRRAPAILAQEFLSVDHMVGGGSIFALAAGEQKQFAPYGWPRDRPFARMEDTVQIVKLLMNAQEPVSFDGEIFTMRDAILALPPYEGKAPQIWVAGSNPRALRIAGQYADGWVTFGPGPSTPEQFAAEREVVRGHAKASGRDPDELYYADIFLCGMTDDPNQLDLIYNSPVNRWNALVLIGTGAKWREWGYEHPLGDDWSYPRDLIPMEWSREDALALVDQVPPDAVAKTHVMGSVLEAADQIQPYIDAGCNCVIAGNYAPGIVDSGRYSDEPGESAVRRLFRELRTRNRVEVPATFLAADAAVG